MTDKRKPSNNNDKPSKGREDIPSWGNRPVYDGVPIGDRIDSDRMNETRGTGPRAPADIKGGNKGRKR